jgi:hypothetical protein
MMWREKSREYLFGVDGGGAAATINTNFAPLADSD